MTTFTLINNKNVLERKYGANMHYFNILVETLGEERANEAIINELDVKTLNTLALLVLESDQVLIEEDLLRKL